MLINLSLNTYDMLQLKSAEHFNELLENLYEDKVTSDILIRSNNRTLSAHSSLLLQHVGEPLVFHVYVRP